MNVMNKLPVKILIGIVTVALACVSGTAPEIQQTAFEEKAFIASDQKLVQIYTMDETGKLREAKTVPRGTKVTVREEEPTKIGGETVWRIYPDDADVLIADADIENVVAADPYAADTDTVDPEILDAANTDIDITDEEGEVPADAPLYVDPKHLTTEWSEVVQEKELFVRTPATMYQHSEGPEIAGFAPKGTRLEVTGFAGLDENGAVAKYKVRPVAGAEDTAAATRNEATGKRSDKEKAKDKEQAKDQAPEGFIYSKYLVRSQEKAEANYNEHGEYDKAKKAKYGMNLYGGKATGLDYYPYERTKIKGKEFCTEARAMYLNWYAVMHGKEYVKLIKQTNCNAVVIDIKDGTLSYKSPVAKELAPKAYKKAHVKQDDFVKAVKEFRKAVKEAKGEDVYVIGRITCFNDKNYGKDHPEDCIKTKISGSGWPSAYSRDVWYYNVALAEEAVKLMDLDEIQFDYVRFPEAAYEMSLDKKTNFRNEYDESKAQAIQNFCFYAADQIHEAGAYFSVDVFGECSNGYVTAYGQYWPAISNVVDAISSMPYTDHFGSTDTWSQPKAIMTQWAKHAAKEQKKIPTPAVARTWITGYNTPCWAPQVTYDKKKLKQQVDALYKAGLDGGFIPWNSASAAGTYKSYKGIWDYEK